MTSGRLRAAKLKRTYISWRAHSRQTVAPAQRIKNAGAALWFKAVSCRQQDGRRGLGSDALAATGEAQSLRGRCLYRNTGRLHAKDIREPGDHGGGIGRDPGAFADQGDV